jgi:hypothetical protein
MTASIKNILRLNTIRRILELPVCIRANILLNNGLKYDAIGGSFMIGFLFGNYLVSIIFGNDNRGGSLPSTATISKSKNQLKQLEVTATGGSIDGFFKSSE